MRETGGAINPGAPNPQQFRTLPGKRGRTDLPRTRRVIFDMSDPIHFRLRVR
jgi:hypothetical protein